MKPIYLHRPGTVSAAGRNVSDAWRTLCAGNWPELPVHTCPVTGRSWPVGAVSGSLRPFPETLPDVQRNRTNQLLWHALADVEDDIERAKTRFGAGRVAVVMGTSTSGVDENLTAFRFVADGGSWRDSGFRQWQQCLFSPAEFTAERYGLGGLSYVISTACTSGARALISAARLLHTGLADAVVCGGVDSLSVLTINGFASLSVLSDRRAEPFSPQRCGINIGEAAAVFVATREPLCGTEETLCLLGWGADSDAWHMSSPRPDAAGAKRAVQAALAMAGVQPDDIGWVNTHGTGTEQNDAMESAALAAVLGQNVPCTSTKPVTGHTLGAAGALEAAWLWAAVSRRINAQGVLPPQYLPHGRDPQLPQIALTDSRWHGARRVGLSTSFAFGGSNAALVIGETV